ncbi:MAG: hypothetical protein IMZ61_00220 [Planctomycetes bacterium]|nr:hypothetical protein [Planctomycetota bacterium]
MSNANSAVSTATESDQSWKPLFMTGSILAFVYTVMVILPLVLIFTTPQPPATGGLAVLSYIASHKGIYLTELICFVGLSIPAICVFFALAILLLKSNKVLAALGGLVGVVSEIVALALGGSPESLHGGLVYLSNQYALASSEAQRLALSTAAESLIATVNSVSSAGVLTALAILLLSLCMLRGTVGRGVAIFGIVTGILGIVLEAIRPVAGMFYALYGILLPIWFIVVGIMLFKASTRSTRAAIHAS